MKKLLLLAFLAGLTVARPLTVSGFGEIIGYVQDIYGDVLHIAGESPAEDGFFDVLVRVGNAPVFDLQTGFRTCAEEIDLHTDIRTAFVACLDCEETHDAVVVWLNWNEPDAAVFTVSVGENINMGGDGTVFLSADGKYRVVLTAETEIICPYAGILTPWEVSPGMEFFVWVDIITASTPAMVYPQKVVLVD